MRMIANIRRPPPEREDLGDDSEASIYERLRDDIIHGRVKPNERLKVAELASRMGTSTNPVREALQQLRGEGFVLMTPNRGARVRPIDEEFVRDICEIEVLIEPALTRWFVGIVTKADIEELERIQAEIEALNFADQMKHSNLDLQFHRLMYDRHYNRHAVDLWVRHRQILWAISRRFPTSLSRQSNVLEEHRELIACIKAQDAEGAAQAIAKHVSGSGRHITEHMRLARLASQT
ncbi:GntR family transcriptional regulator [Microvirga ossetica]|uniref:GntR family transcriptional regulator n=1 Tax=Microvirga ossetica TaxID=1882682 RepID=A0A1B2EM46_9HYPH|nr:GntR family transcriptional regulator [Microvirga ossetica]ANY81048.1 GntR family transcriptional regulator [Microvirga ossetica]